MHGFLVVLANPLDFLEGKSNKKYRGVDRLPPFPSDIPEEKQAMEEYVFGPYTDDDGVIPNLGMAKRLLSLFAASRRKFEVIYYEDAEGSGSKDKGSGLAFLGFDVACPGGDRWSIVADFPPEKAMQDFKPHLNDNGLFGSVEVASEFLAKYRHLKLADHDLNLHLLGVYRVSSRESARTK